MTGAAIAVIPARRGSKRVPRKNIRMLMDRPLIAYTIEAALKSGVFERVFVSTDCPEIAKVAETAGAEVPFLRQEKLSDDYTPVSAATVDMLMRLDPPGTHFHHVAQLMANCPLRDADDVIDSFQQFTETGTLSQISVVRYGWQNPWWAMRRNEDQSLVPLFREAQSSRSQDLPALFCPTGAIWWARADILRARGTYHVTGRTGWEIAWQKGMDIDTEEDWEMTEVLMSRLHSSSGAAGLSHQAGRCP